MTTKAFAMLCLLTAAGLIDSGRLMARVVDLGLVDDGRNETDGQAAGVNAESRDAVPGNEAMPFRGNGGQRQDGLFSAGVVSSTLAAGAGPDVAQGDVSTPWALRKGCSFASLVPSISTTLVIGGTARTLLHDVTKITAAPKAETWLTLLVGLGLVSVQLRRAQRSLQHHPLSVRVAQRDPDR